MKKIITTIFTALSITACVPPALWEVTPIGTSSSSTPQYTFHSEVFGELTYGGSCSSDTSYVEQRGDITITLDSLADGTYDDCTITIKDEGVLNWQAETLLISSFTIDNPPAIGSTMSNPGLNCNDILTQEPTSLSGIYWIQPTTSASAFEAYCNMSIHGGGWTLIESFSLQNSGAYLGASFMENRPRYAASPNLTDFRFSKLTMLEIYGDATKMLSTCNEASTSNDYVQFDIAAAFAGGGPMTTIYSQTMLAVDSINIRGIRVNNTVAPFWNSPGTWHMHIDSSAPAFPWNAGAIFDEDNFGRYIAANPAFGCTASPASTTNWWLR